ncbi:replication-associated protein [Crucivirus-514]|nr:replication-associated protein [Crucivirus-514]
MSDTLNSESKSKTNPNKREPAFRSWTFVLNNPACHDADKKDPVLLVIPVTAKCCVYQYEVGEQGTKHFQGFVTFKSPTRFTQCKAWLPEAHWEVMRKDEDTNAKYCSKSKGNLAGPWFYGILPQQGKRSDLAAVVDMVIAHKSVTEIAMAHPTTFIRNNRGIEKLVYHMEPKRDFLPDVMVFYGPPGTGKSFMAWDIAPKAYAKPSSSWWDGYDGHTDVIIDDFTWPHDQSERQEWLRVFDRYPHVIPVKGGYRQLLARRMIITTNDDVALWPEQLRRRVSTWRSFVEPMNVPLILQQRAASQLLLLPDNAESKLPAGVTVANCENASPLQPTDVENENPVDFEEKYSDVGSVEVEVKRAQGLIAEMINNANPSPNRNPNPKPKPKPKKKQRLYKSYKKNRDKFRRLKRNAFIDDVAQAEDTSDFHEYGSEDESEHDPEHQARFGPVVSESMDEFIAASSDERADLNEIRAMDNFLDKMGKN